MKFSNLIWLINLALREGRLRSAEGNVPSCPVLRLAAADSAQTLSGRSKGRHHKADIPLFAEVIEDDLRPLTLARSLAAVSSDGQASCWRLRRRLAPSDPDPPETFPLPLLRGGTVVLQPSDPVCPQRGGRGLFLKTNVEAE